MDPLTAEEWKDHGAATIIHREMDGNAQLRTAVIKKGVMDFNFGRTLGEGSYSTVVAATDRQTLREYAIKVLDKRHIIREKKVKYVNIEKNTLNRLGEHPGIVRLYYTFQDQRSLYFVLDFAANGELLSLIKKVGSLDESCTRYYTCQITDAVEFMHSKGVVHRDLKPENILLDDKMRIKITDFGTAKLLEAELDENGNPTDTYPADVRANSFVGTAEYVSPELLTDKATGKGSDIWALGCIIYQLIAGRPPFKASNEYLTFQKIIKLQYSYTPSFPQNIRDLVQRLLVSNPQARLTIEQVKAHHFFEGISWDRKYIWKQPPPPIQPFGATRSKPKLTPQSVSKTEKARLLYHNLGPATSRPLKPPTSNDAPISATNYANAKSTSHQARSAVLAMSRGSTAKNAASGPLHDTIPSRLAPSSSTSNASIGVYDTHGEGLGMSGADGSIDARSKSAFRPHVARAASAEVALRAQASKDAIASASAAALALAKRSASNSRQQQPTQVSYSRGDQARSPSSRTTDDGVNSIKTTSSFEKYDASEGTKLHLTALHKALPNVTPQQEADRRLPSVGRKTVRAPSQVDLDWAHIFVHADERILHIGLVAVSCTSKIGSRDDDLLQEQNAPEKDHGLLTKFFSANKKRKRVVIITSFCRFLIMTADEESIQYEVLISAPDTFIQEYPYSRRAGFGSFAIETDERLITIEDTRGSLDWISAFKKSLNEEEFDNTVSTSNSPAAASAAHLAANAAGINGNGIASSPVSAIDRGAPRRVTAATSSFLIKNEERKRLR